MKRTMNKRGDVPTAIFVIGIIAVYLFALVSFFISMSRTKGIIIETNIMEDMNKKIDRYYFYKNMNEMGNDEIMTFLDARTDGLGKKYFYAEGLRGNKKVMYLEYYLSP